MSSWSIEGAILPGELPDRIARQDKQLGGLAPADYHLGSNENVRSAASRAWSYLESTYHAFRAELTKIPSDEPATGLTREAWLAPLFRELGYGRVAPSPGGHLTAGDGDDQREYPISHLWNDVPIHLLGWNVSLDSRSKGVRGAARAPQSMMQEYLNRKVEHLWAILSNGRTMRLLRDSTNLVGQAYVEFDLETIFDNEQFSDFVFLFALCHESRLERFPGEGDEPAPVTDRWIEQWRNAGIELGTRALASLRGQVEQAIEALGTGYLQHPNNTELRERISSDDPSDRITSADFQRALLRQVYRLLFWMVAEDRGALLAPKAPTNARERYRDYFSSKRLRGLARTRVGTRHHDLATQTQLVFNGLGQTTGIPEIGLPGLGGIFTPTALDVLNDASIDNVSFLNAIRLLSTTKDASSDALRAVDFQHLGAEELGGIYEALLELHPRIDPAARTFTLVAGAGNERKMTGSYYTPSSLIDLVLDTSLDPLLDRAETEPTQGEREKALLALRVCDPACGSGHFLVAAARRIANRLARVRSDESEPSIDESRVATRDVIMSCIYGVDLNPMAAELAKVSLWLEAIEPGIPLGFLDAHIKVGNSLIGTTPALLAQGIPDGAYAPVTGDERAIATGWRNQNKREISDQTGQMTFLEESLGSAFSNTTLVDRTKSLAALPTTSLDDVALQEARYSELRSSKELRTLKLAADAWTAAFFQRKAADNPAAITTRTVHAIESGRDIDSSVTLAIETLASAHRFFHWHVEFPDIFAVPEHESTETDPDTGWVGGFDAVIGNPPWETVQMSEKEFFAERDPDIANASTAAKRKKLIARLGSENPVLAREYWSALRESESTNVFVRGSSRYPLTAKGKTNTYAIFAETFRTVINAEGRAGIITPTGLATDATTADFFADTLRAKRLAAFYDFENSQPVFHGVHRSFRFAVTALVGRGGFDGAVPMAFMLHDPADATARAFTLTPEEILLLNPNTGTLPVFASRRDADITLGIYKRHPVLIKDGDPDGNPWGLTFRQGLFNMSSDSDKFRTRDDLEALGAEFDGWAWNRSNPDGTITRWLPLYEAKLLSHYDHRFATYKGAEGQSLPRITDAEHDDPNVEPLARYWVLEKEVNEAIGTRTDRDWLFGWRDIARNTDVRTMIPSILPRSAVGDKFLLMFNQRSDYRPLLQATVSSLAFDFVTRQKASGTSLKAFLVRQIAAPTQGCFTNQAVSSSAVRGAVLELTHTSWTSVPLDGGGSPPFRWNKERRTLIQAELDALVMQVYGLERHEVEHILDSFPVLCRREERECGEFRTRRFVLDFYDRMAAAKESGTPYETPITPPPGQGPRHSLPAGR